MKTPLIKKMAHLTWNKQLFFGIRTLALNRVGYLGSGLAHLLPDVSGSDRLFLTPLFVSCLWPGDIMWMNQVTEGNIYQFTTMCWWSNRNVMRAPLKVFC